MNAKYYYRLVDIIASCFTIAQIEACERMINSIVALYASDLANMALIRKCEIITNE